MERNVQGILSERHFLHHRALDEHLFKKDRKDIRNDTSIL